MASKSKLPAITPKKVFAALPTAERGKPVKITGDPKGENFLYCNGQSIFIRNIQELSKVDIYTEHSKPTTIARYSPSRFYIASADITGKIRIWDTVNPEHICKAEYPVLGGAILDVDWSSDSQRLVVCGAGREKLAHVFAMETGTSLGEIIGHSNKVNTCSYRQSRPFRIVTASEDRTVALHEGPPFKFLRSFQNHSNFVNVARYSKSGDVFISGGADGRLFKFDGKSGDELGEIGSPAHKGGIYDLTFSPNEKQILTVSGDKTAKIFDVQSGNLVTEFVMGDKDWQDMQLGCLWQGPNIISVNARGHLIFHSLETPDQPLRVVKGHMKPITSLAVTRDGSKFFTGGLEGIGWEAGSGTNDIVQGPGHTSEVTDLAVDDDILVSVGVDDFVRFSSVSTCQFSDGQACKLDSQPKAVDARNGVVVTASVQQLTVFLNGKKVFTLPVKSEAHCVSIHPGGFFVAVGHKDSKVRIYSLQSGALSENQTVPVKGEPSALAYSPDGAYLAIAADRHVMTFSVHDYKELSDGETHTARVKCLAWSPDSSRFVTGGLDSWVILWDDVNCSFKERPKIRAHTMSHANQIAWLDSHTVITVGQDANVKQFSITD